MNLTIHKQISCNQVSQELKKLFLYSHKKSNKSFPEFNNNFDHPSLVVAYIKTEKKQYNTHKKGEKKEDIEISREQIVELSTEEEP